MIELGFIDYIKSYFPRTRRDARAESFYFLPLNEKIKDMVGMNLLDYATLDSIFEDDKRYRPDAAISFAFSRDMSATILIEIDEHAHNGRSIESEQRKVIKELICCAKQGIKYFHLIRVNVGSRLEPHQRQVEVNAELLREELYGNSQAVRDDIEKKLEDSSREMYVRVTLLDFDDHHHHVKAYEDRLIPPGHEVRAIADDDDWETLLIYDEVVKKKSGAAFF